MVPEHIPAFEGRPVDGLTFKIASTASIELDGLDSVVSIDDRVQMLSVYVVTDVRHFVNKDGKLMREHIIKPQAMATFPFDENDPSDDGILRALPSGSVTTTNARSDSDDEDEGGDD